MIYTIYKCERIQVRESMLFHYHFPRYFIVYGFSANTYFGLSGIPIEEGLHVHLAYGEGISRLLVDAGVWGEYGIHFDDFSFILALYATS